MVCAIKSTWNPVRSRKKKHAIRFWRASPGIRGEVGNRQAITGIERWPTGLIAQAGIHREPRMELDIVLRVKRDVAGAEIGRGIPADADRDRWQAQQQVFDGVTGDAEKTIESARELVDIAVVRDVENIGAEAQLMDAAIEGRVPG